MFISFSDYKSNKIQAAPSKFQHFCLKKQMKNMSRILNRKPAEATHILDSLALQSILVIKNVLIRNKLVLISWNPMPIYLHTDKEHLALRNNSRVTKKFLITKFDCTYVDFNAQVEKAMPRPRYVSY